MAGIFGGRDEQCNVSPKEKKIEVSTAPGALDLGSYVLLSGGIDSYVCLKLESEFTSSIQAIFVNYGQPAAAAERRSALAAATRFDAVFVELTTASVRVPLRGEIQARNAALIFSSILALGIDRGRIIIGLHAGCPYYDTSVQFVADVQRLLDGYTGGKLQLLAPLASWDKSTIFAFAVKEKLPLHLMHSCESSDEPCGECLSCQNRKSFLSITKEN